MPQEIELKLAIKDNTSDIAPTLHTLLPNLSLEPKPLRNVYFDTPDLTLNQNRIALRIRQNGNQFIQTLKTKGVSVNGLTQRGEWEWDLAEEKLNITMLSECEAWPKDVDAFALRPAFQTNFVRQQGQFSWQNSRIELAIDQGEIISGGLTETISEIELELIEGDTNSIIELGQLIQSKLSVEQYDVSKAERGYALFKQAESRH